MVIWPSAYHWFSFNTKFSFFTSPLWRHNSSFWNSLYKHFIYFCQFLFQGIFNFSILLCLPVFLLPQWMSHEHGSIELQLQAEVSITCYFILHKSRTFPLNFWLTTLWRRGRNGGLSSSLKIFPHSTSLKKGSCMGDGKCPFWYPNLKCGVRSKNCKR